MQITFLGTSAANAYPEAFCKCKNCIRARQSGGVNLRKRSSALINNDLLIDLGPDIMSSAQIHGISLEEVQYCLQTHPHADHLDLSHLLSRSPGFGVVGAPKLNFYASQATLVKADRTFRTDLSNYGLLDMSAEDELNLKVHPVQPYKPFPVGPYQVIAFPANHGEGSSAYLYALAKDDKQLFYGADTAEFLDETWIAFRHFNLKFDLVVLDHTYGPGEMGTDHLSAALVAAYTNQMHEDGTLKETGQVFATHIAHEGNPPHAELTAYAEQNGYEIAYDGLVVIF